MKESPVFGGWVKQERKALGLTQVELAQLVGCAVVTIKQIETNRRRPSKQLAELLMKHLNIPAEQRMSFLQLARALGPIHAVPLYRFPPQFAPFIGRQTELSALKKLIVDTPTCRLLTLVGPGGIGKTCLAIQLGRDVAQVFPDGVAFVSLEHCDTEQLVPTIAQTLQLALYHATDTVAQLLAHLQERTLLLILDNFEHLAESAADLLSRIVRDAPNIKLLITSRDRLELHEEWTFDLQGLAFPEESSLESTVALERYSAVALFMQCALRVSSNFALRDSEHHDVIRICQLVGGMPLALELAASWVRVLSSQAIFQGIEQNLDFLVASSRNASERHRSIRPVFEYSWNLLSEAEQGAFKSLCLFQGGFQLDAAEKVAGVPFQMLAALVSKSLVWRAGNYYKIHELLRQYGEEKLNETPESKQALQDAHAAYYLEFVGQQGTAQRGHDPKAAWNAIEQDLGNIRLAWNYAAEQRNFQALSQASGSLFRYFRTKDRQVEGWRLFQHAVRSLGDAEKLSSRNRTILAQLWARTGSLAINTGNFNEGFPLLSRSVEILRVENARHELVFPLLLLGYNSADYHSKIQLFTESCELAREVGDKEGLARAMLALWVFSRDKDKPLHMEALAIARDLEAFECIADTLMVIAWHLTHQARYREAQNHYEQALSHYQQIDDLVGSISAKRNIAEINGILGQFAEAELVFDEVLKWFRKRLDSLSTMTTLNLAGRVAYAAGQYEQARQYYEEVLDIATALNNPSYITAALNGLGAIEMANARYAQALEYHEQARQKEHDTGLPFSYATHFGFGEAHLGLYKLQDAKQDYRHAIEKSLGVATQLLALLGYAECLLQEGDIEQALELIYFAAGGPAAEWCLIQARLRDMLGRLESTLPNDVATQIKEQAQSLKLDAVLARISHNTSPSP